ncbi:MAG: ShlB/FhaC/HecB family hemolysin secretion/activation protein, partial [Duganella sp.]
KWNANVSRLQGLSPVDSLALSAAAQWTDGNLDSAEKMSVGDPYTVRAYDVGAVSSDSGYFASAELRHDFGASAAGRWQAMAFVEAAHVKLNHRAWDAADNSATLSGVGLGLAWDGGAGWRANLSLAAPVGGRPSMATPPTSARAWLTASKAF